MPKELHEIKKFITGTVSSPTTTDIPDDAASYSINIDPVAENGILKGVPQDITLKTDGTFGDSSLQAFDADKMAMINNDGQRDVVAYEADTNKIWNIVDFQGGASGYITGTTFACVNSNPDTITDSGNGFVSAGFEAGQQITVTGFTDSANNGTFVLKTVVAGTLTLDDSHALAVESAGDTVIISALVIDKGAQTNSTDTCTMQVNNKEVHIGMGKGVDDKPLWCGIVPHKQFGTAITGLQLEDAELKSPTTFPAMHKTVQDNSGYLYGIEYGGSFLWKFRISDKTIYDKSVSIFSSSTAMCHFNTTTSSGFLWIFDNGVGTYGTLYKVDTTTMQIVQTNQLDNPGAAAGHVLQDMIVTTNRIWFAYAHITTGTAIGGFVEDNLLYRTAIPSSTATLDLVAGGTNINVTPESRPDCLNWDVSNCGLSVYSNSAAYSHATVPPDTGTWALQIAVFRPYRNCLARCSDDATQVIWLTQVKIASSGAQIYCIYYHNYNAGIPLYKLHAYPLGPSAAYIIKEDYVPTTVGATQHTKLVAVDLEGTASNEILTTIIQGNASLKHLYLSGVGSHLNQAAFKFADHISEFDDYVTTGSYDSGLNPWEVDTGSRTHEIEASTEYTFTTGTDGYEQLRMAWNNASPIQIMSGNGVGKWGTVDSNLANPTYDKISVLELDITNVSAVVNSDWQANVTYFWKASFLYDGYQEGPLSSSYKATQQAGADHITIDQLIKTRVYDVANNLPKRVSHINIYRADNSTSNAETTNKGFYRLIKSFAVDSTFVEQLSDTWGVYREKEHTDTFSPITASYEALTGISEVLTEFKINYSLSAQLNNHHFIANCSHIYVDNADLYIFKSKPYNYNQFDWSEDLLRLPTKPTALASFNGRIYAFDENHTYRIEPQNFYIEDTYEGVGCLGPESVVVTEYGMCFADKNNIYLHDGRQPVPIGDPILTDASPSSWGWHARVDWDPKVMFDAKRNSFIVMAKYASNFYAWTFNISRKRWDLWQLFGSSEPKGILSGKNGEMFISNGTNLVHYLGHTTTTRTWYWYSKKFTMGQDTQIKKFRKFRVVGSPSGSLGTNTYVKIDGSDVTESGSNTEFTVSSQNGKHVQLFFYNQTGEVDAFGIIYRRRPIR